MRRNIAWLILGVGLFAGIAAVSTDTSFFKNISSSGWLSLSGQTNRLTVASGELKLDGTTIGSGGSSPWTNVSGVIKPAPGQTTNVLQFVSGMADNATNVASFIDSAATWTYPSVLTAFRNNGTNVAEINSDGALRIGRDLHDSFFNDETDIGIRRTEGFGDLRSAVYVTYAATPSADYNFWVDLSEVGAQMQLDLDQNDSIYWYAGNGLAYQSFEVAGGDVAVFNPGVADGGSAVAWDFDTANTLANAGAKVIRVRNNGSERFAFYGSGILAITGANNSLSIDEAGVQFSASLAVDDTFQGTRIAGLNNSGGVTQWDTVYLNSSSQWVLADANGTGTYPARGIASATVATGNATTVITSGTIRNDAWNWTPGGTIYLSTTPGGLTQTQPSASGDKIQVMGYALTADIMAVAISADYGTVP